MDGTINVFKPIGMSSHDVVNIIRKKFKTKKVGHAGTLDPNASGVLILCIGKATRISEYLLNLDKEYIGELTLGIETDTQDKEGKILNYSQKIVRTSDINDAFKKHTGWLEQTPPMYSALKHKGKKLYQLAREGKVVERKPRKTFIESLKVLNIENNRQILFKVKCSKGTYIRTLCDDIGKSLGTYGYMSYLIRIQVGSFHISNSYSIEYINNLKEQELNTIINPMDESLSFIDSIYINSKYYNSIINGAMVPANNILGKTHKVNTVYRIYCKNIFIGLGKIIENHGKSFIKMDKVLV
ncbi:MAG: tRNA pseudouridine(55) synthase TruB [Tissierellia bacterium]|nr:tRNA pseudouridine(55) synthase TruB [Tissierellia bacterium]